MCIAFVATKKQGLPSEETLQHIFKSNPDGAGYVSVYTPPSKKRLMRMEKGIMNYKDFKDKLGLAFDLMTDDEDYIVAHTRIATSGGVSASKTHPFRMSDGSYLFHNGIASGVSVYMDKSESDTEWLAKHTTTLEQIANYDGLSRYLIVRPNGKMEKTDNWLKDDDGRWWTNSDYKPYPIYSYRGAYGYGHGYHYDEYDDYDAFGAYRGYNHTKPKSSPASTYPIINHSKVDLTPSVPPKSDDCVDGTCTINLPYTRKDFARYELLKRLTRTKTLNRIEHTIAKHDLEYDREANAWFSGMDKIDLNVAGGNVNISKPKKEINQPLSPSLNTIISRLGDEETSSGSELMQFIQDGVTREIARKYGEQYVDNIVIFVKNIRIKYDFTNSDYNFVLEYRFALDPGNEYRMRTGSITPVGIALLIEDMMDDIHEVYFS